MTKKRKAALQWAAFLTIMAASAASCPSAVAGAGTAAYVLLGLIAVAMAVTLWVS
jgi:hypothetical protein